MVQNPVGWHRRLLAAFLAVALPCAALHAQRLRGVVVLADSTTRAAGVIVLVEGLAGESAARALTSERGDFDVALPRPGRYVVRVLRIGYRPTVVPPFDVTSGERHEMRIVLTRNATALTRVTVRGERSCRVRQDSGQLVARAWEEARKAITASQLSAGTPLTAEWIEYDRTFDSAGRFVRRQKIRSTRSVTTHAFRSLPDDSLARVGYVVVEGEGARYFAPDADVLLSESFARTHCFSIEPAPEKEPGLIGVGFQPEHDREREGIRDIEGIFWLDRASAELRRLEYRYTGLHPVASDAGAGGRVEFLRLASGSWLINRWNIRMPRLLATPGRVRNPFGTSISSALPRVQAIELAGGEVTLVLRGDTVLHRATGATLLARIISRDPTIGIRGGALTVDGTDYSAHADSTGLLRITPVLTGNYHVRLTTAAMDAMGAAPSEFDIDVQDGTPREATLTLPGAVELLRRACGDRSASQGVGQLRGTVRDVNGNPIADTKVTVAWQGAFDVVAGGILRDVESRDIVTDGLGRWRLCGVPRQTSLSVKLASHPDADHPEVPGFRTRLGEDEPFAEVNLVVAAVATARDSAGRGERPPGQVEIMVADRAGRPLADATVDIVTKGAALTSVRTDSAGRAFVANVPSGRVDVRTRRIGFRAGDVAVDIEPGRNTIPLVLDKSATPSLDTVRIRGDRRVSSRLDEFETRRLRGEATASISRDEIVKRNPVYLSQVLRGVPGVQVRDSLGRAKLASSRGMIPKNLKMELCWMRIMVDGVMLPAESDIDNIPPVDVHGIEVFAGAASIPLKYASLGMDNWCGLVAIWTRDR